MSGQRVGVVGDDDLGAAVAAAGGEAVAGPPAALGTVDLVVAVGGAAMVDLARADLDAPVLPVAAGAGIRSVPRDHVDAALASVFDESFTSNRHPVLVARNGGDGVRLLYDVALMSSEPARISEFSVHYADDQVARFRADGVVASTPAGSHGYNRAADGSVLTPETDVLSVVPIAPFATDADQWVLPFEDVSFSVERDETPVELLVDGRIERTLHDGDTVTLAQEGTVETLVVDESDSLF